MSRERTIGSGTAQRMIASVLLLSAIGCGRWEARSELKKGNAAYKGGDYDAAIEHYDMVSRDTVDGVRATLNTGYAHWKSYRFGSQHPIDRNHAAAAVEAFEKYVTLRPADKQPSKEFPAAAEIDERIITLLIDSERYQDAIDRMNAALESKPNDAAILRGIATAYDKWGKPTSALHYFLKWAEQFPETESPHVAIAAYAWNQSYRLSTTMSRLDRNRWIDTGLNEADLAIAINAEHFEALTYRNLLLRERAKMRLDPDQIAKLMSEASELLAKAKEIREKQRAEEERKAKEEMEKEGGEGAEADPKESASLQLLRCDARAV